MVKERAKIDIISLVCSGVIGVTLALNGFTYYGLAIQTIIYIGVCSLLKFIYSPWKPSFLINLHPLKLMFGFSSKLILTNIFTQISNNIFSVVLGKFYSPQQLGFYSQGQKWMGMGNQFITGMINSVSLPVLANVIDDKERQIMVFRKMVRFGSFVSFPAMFGLAFVSNEFISILLGSKWLPTVPFLQLFCVWGAISFLWLLYTNLIVSYNRSDTYLFGMVLTGLLQLIIVAVLSQLGIYIMLIGYIAVYYGSLLYWHYFVNKLIGLSVMEIAKDILPYLLITMFSLFIAWLATYYVVDLYIAVIVKIVVSAFMYVLISRFFDSIILSECVDFLRNKMS